MEFSNNSKVSTIAPSVERVTRPWAITAILGSIFIERFIFYAALNVIRLHFDTLGDAGEDLQFTHLRWTLFTIAPILLGLLFDFMLERRLSLVVGAALMGLGLVLLASGTFWPLLIGLSMFVVGSSAFKLSTMVYYGYLWPKSGLKIEGGFALLWTVHNLGAYLSTFGAHWWYSNYEDYRGFLTLLGILSLLLAALLGVLALTRALPSLPKIGVAKTPSRSSNLGGIVTIGLIVLLTCSTFLLLGKMLPISVGKIVLQVTLLLALVLGFLVLRMRDQESDHRRSLIVLLLGLTFLVVGGIQSIPSAITANFQHGALKAETRSLAVTLTLCMTTLLWLILAGLSDHRQRGFKGIVNLVMIGSLVLILDTGIELLVPVFGEFPIVVSGITGPFGDMLFGPLVYALVWRMSPDHLKAIGMGFLISIFGLRGPLSNVFEGSYDGSATSLLIPTLGIVFLGALGIGLILGVRALLRRRDGDNLLE